MRLSLLLLSIAIGSAAAAPAEDVKSLVAQCGNFESLVPSLGTFGRFYASYSQLTDRLRGSTQPSEDDKAAEVSCEKNGLVFSLVEPLGKLVERIPTRTGVCTIEYASKLYHLHNQLQTLDVGGSVEKLRRILNLLGNFVSAQCRRSLDDRLKDVEKRAPDSLKHLNLVAGLLNIGQSKLMKLPVQVEQFVPLLDSELPTMANLMPDSITKSYEFKLTTQMRVGIDGIKISCRALKPYHVNILGSLGLLASAGFAGSAKNLEQEPRESANRIRLWLVSAQLCQVMRNVLKMSSLNTEGKASSQILVSGSKEADVSTSDESDSTFASYNLPELSEQVDLDAVSTESQASYPDRSKLNLRKLQLAFGPSYRLASAINAYLDLTQPANRLNVAYDILGLEMSAKVSSGDDDEDDDDEDDD